MITVRGQSGGAKLIGARRPSESFTVTACPRYALVSGESAGQETVADVVYDTYTAATHDQVYDARVGVSDPRTGNGYAFSVSDPAVASIDAYGRMTRLTDGQVRIIVTGPTGAMAQSGLVNVARLTGQTNRTFNSFAAGSLARHVDDWVNAAIDGLTAATAKPIFSTQNHAASTYVRNAGCWAASIVEKLTCLSPWNSYDSYKRAGTAITPRHVAYAHHYLIPHGAVLRFIAADNSVIERTLVNSARIGTTDLRIGVLNADLPASITPCKIAPPDLLTCLPSLGVARVPALCLDQEEKALLSGMGGANWFGNCRTEGQQAYYESKIVGDSGNPAFLIVDGVLVLLTVWTYGGGGSGPAVCQLNTEIAAACTALGGGHTPSAADLSAFNP